jgi:predicted GIY-YIG superfamily endonuclease
LIIEVFPFTLVPNENQGGFMLWHVYMLRLQNDCIYVGLTDDLERRLAEHQSGNGGKTTSDSQPVALIYSESLPDRFAAAKRERQLKRWSRAKKLALAEGRFVALHRLAKRRGRNALG